MLAEAVATSLLALWLQWRQLCLNPGPVQCRWQAATGTAAHLSCQHNLWLPRLYLTALFEMCMGSLIKRVMHFSLYSKKESGS